MIQNPANILVDVQGRPVSVDPFGNLRVAEPYTVGDLTSKYDFDAREFGSQVVGGGTVTHLPAHSAIKLAVTGANGDAIKTRTHTYFKYQAGKSTMVRQSLFHSDAGQANQTRRWGLFDDNDGLFWELSGTTMGIVKRSSTSGSPVDTRVDQTNWNVDKLNGSGPSQVTLDVTKGNIYEIQLEWLGVGYVKFLVNGILVHEIKNPNSVAGAYMRTAVLPLQMQIVNSGASAPGWFARICGTVFVDAGNYPPAWGYGVGTASALTVGTGAELPLLSIRPSLTFNGITNRMLMLPHSCSLGSKSSALIIYRIVMNATLTGPAWNPVSTKSGMEFDVAASALSGGETLLTGYLNAPTRLDLSDFFAFLGRKLRLDAFATADAQDKLTVAVISDSGNVQVRGSFAWDEIR